MTTEELKTTILVGSYLQNVGIGRTHLQAELPKELTAIKELADAAKELAGHGLIEPIEIKIPNIKPENFCSQWQITPKGEDLVRNLDREPSTMQELGIFDKFRIVIATGGSRVTFHDEEHHSATNINITNIKDSIVKEIQQSKANESEKQEAKSRLTKFFEHPLLKTAFEAVVSAAIKAAG